MSGGIPGASIIVKFTEIESGNVNSRPKFAARQATWGSSSQLRNRHEIWGLAQRVRASKPGWLCSVVRAAGTQV